MDHAGKIVASPLTPTQRVAVMIDARRQALNAVTRRYQALRLKVHHIPMQVIGEAANEYLLEHPELISRAELILQAKETIRRREIEGSVVKGVGTKLNSLGDAFLISRNDLPKVIGVHTGGERH